MTQDALSNAVTATIDTWVAKMILRYAKDVARLGEKDARALWREEHGLIFVKGYTVSPRFRHYKKVLFPDLPKTSKRILEALRHKSVH